MIETVKNFKENLITSGNIENAAILIIYCIFFIGCTLLVGDYIQEVGFWIKGFIEKHRTKARLRKKETSFDKHIRYLLEANQISSAITVFRFKYISFGIFLFFLVLSIRVLFIGTAIMLATALAAIPYLYLRVKLEKVRSKASHEAELLISEILVKYRVKKYNIEEAIEDAMKLSGLKKTRGMLARLLLKLRNTRSEKEIKEAVNIFAYSIGTNWAKMLGSNIYQSSVNHINVTLSLEDMLIQLREARKLWEAQFKNTAEPRRILWCIPILYIFLMCISLYYLDVPGVDYVHNQFGSQQGLMMFLFIVLGFFGSWILVILLFSRKFDF